MKFALVHEHATIGLIFMMFQDVLTSSSMEYNVMYKKYHPWIPMAGLSFKIFCGCNFTIFCDEINSIKKYQL
jgi:hypothetical protein